MFLLVWIGKGIKKEVKLFKLRRRKMNRKL